MENEHQRVLFYAPNVHVGGGLVLLKAILNENFQRKNVVLWLDFRAKSLVTLNPDWKVVWVKPSFRSRINAQFSLYSEAAETDIVFCFHGLPPVLKCRGSVNVFLQNRNYLGTVPLSNFSLRTKLRLALEQTICKAFRFNVDTYWVQSPTMALTLKNWFGKNSVNIKIAPFAADFVCKPISSNSTFDFLYIADGEAHKNHKNLIEAWKYLADKNIRPSLCLTLSARDQELKEWIKNQCSLFDLNISDIGQKPHSEILELYSCSKALIFPSKNESFGLPLIEASKCGLPIVAGELDFIRDVCSPVQTFDPESPISIGRAVMRFMDIKESSLNIISPTDFWDTLVQKNV